MATNGRAHPDILVRNGYELVLAEDGGPDKPGWDEHVVKRWR